MADTPADGDVFAVSRLHDPALIRTFLNGPEDMDRARYAYMIGDLSAPYWEQAAFYGAFAPAADLRAVLLYYQPITPPPVISAGDAAAIAAIWPQVLADFDPRRLVYHAQTEHLPVIARFFAMPAPMAMWRMAITRPALAMPTADSAGQTRRLTAQDVADVQALFDSGAAADFMDGRPHVTPALLEGAPFFGHFHADQLLAIAGTHIVSPAEKLGSVGYVFTHPAARGHGYAQLVTAAVTRELFAAGLNLVTLNVKQENAPAVRAYERIGYRRDSALWEGIAIRHDPAPFNDE